MSEREVYLADGVYCSFDGWQIRLRAPREGGDHLIYMDDTVLAAFLAYVDELPKRE